MSNKGQSYRDIRGMLAKVRKINEEQDFQSRLDNKRKGGVPYTDQDELYKYSIESTRQNFGADYTKTTHPMIYDPNDGDVILSGVIPSLGNALFHFRYTEKDGCYVWLYGITPEPKVVDTLSRIYGTYENWTTKIRDYGDRKPIGYRDGQMEA